MLEGRPDVVKGGTVVLKGRSVVVQGLMLHLRVSYEGWRGSRRDEATKMDPHTSRCNTSYICLSSYFIFVYTTVLTVLQRQTIIALFMINKSQVMCTVTGQAGGEEDPANVQ